MNMINNNVNLDRNKTIKLSKYLGHIIRISLWYIYLSKKYDWFLYKKPYYGYLYPYLKYYLLFISIVAIIILTIKYRNFLKVIWIIFSFYFKLLFFPIIIVVYVIRLIGKITIFISKVTKVPRRLEFFVLATCIFIISAILISKYSNVYVLSFSMVGLFLCIFGLWYCIYSWTTNPFALFKRFDLFIDKKWNWLLKRITEIKSEPDERDKSKEIKNRIKVLTWAYKFFDWVINSLIYKARKPSLKLNLTKWFIILYLFILLISIVGFSFEYYALVKINENIFKGIYNYSDALYYSSLTFITMSFGQIHPNSIIAKVITVLEILSTIYLLIFIILIFTTITEEMAKMTVDEIERKMNNRKQKAIEIINQIMSISESELYSLKVTEINKYIDDKYVQNNE